MKDLLNNKVIVIGGDNHNPLGVIRSLGKMGVFVYFVCTKDAESGFVAKSKYLQKTWFTGMSEGKILKVLYDNFDAEYYKPIVIPTSDRVASMIDNNFELLCENFLLPNMSESSGNIVSMMSKVSVISLAASLGIKTPITRIISIGNERNLKQIINNHDIYPVIVKPLSSLSGSVKDILVSHDVDEFKEVLQYYLKKGIKSAFVQEYIDKDIEVGLNGCVTKFSKEIIIPGLVKKLREYPIGSGNVSYGLVTKNTDTIIELSKVKEMLRRLDYCGIFDIEFVLSSNTAYFVEANFRNGGNSYAITKAGCNYLYLWCLDMAGLDISSYEKSIKKSKHFMVEANDFRHIFKSNITFLEWLRSLLRTKFFYIFSIVDPKPFVYVLFHLRKYLKGNRL